MKTNSFLVQMNKIGARKVVFILFPFFISIFVGITIISIRDYRLFVIFGFCCVLPFLRSLFYRHFEFFLCLLIFVNFNTFHILPAFGQYYIYNLMLLPILSVYFFEVLLRKDFRLGKYGMWVLMYIPIIIMGLVVATCWGQPVVLGIKAAKFCIPLIVYFLIVNNKIDVDKFTKYLVILGITLAILGIFQYIFYGKFLIFHLDEKDVKQTMKEIRGLRIREGAFFISTAAVVAFAKYLQKRGDFYLYVFIGFLLYTILIVKTRMQIIGIILTFITLYMIHAKFSLKAVFSFFAIIIIFASIINLFPIKTEFKLAKETRQDLGSYSPGSYTARAAEFRYYFNQFKKSPIIGYGYWNFDWDRNPEEYLQKGGIHLSDLGIAHLMIESGIVGLLWFFYGILKFILRILRGNYPLEAAAYIILGITTIATLDFFLRENTIFIFGIFLGLLGRAHKKNLTNTFKALLT